MEFHHQGVLERERPLPCQCLRAAYLVVEGHGCFEKLEVAGSISVPEEGLGLGKSFDTPYELHARLSFSYLIGYSFVIFVQAI